ncbi:DUF6286 domain-containing protein [Speluncibacter jeojiensis]|uniref:DUF6286 domain-containing protein n=1 Tax=Speluncibacter jeojiensis TaxID=2710754 RepID=A0A9X4RCN0_9ACTN|nr:DUF6286 domain-containing protein [Corynebacteriales bacterium D3-21]
MTTDSPVPTTTATADAVMPAAGRPPAAPPAAGYAGAVLAVILIAAGVLALRDTAVALDWLGGPLWINATIGWIDGLAFAAWMIPAGIAAVLIGGWMVWCALTPRRKTAVPVTARTSVWIEPADLARAASHAAQTVPGVLDVRSTATRRKITVTAHTTDSRDPAIAGAVHDAVREYMTTLVTPPKIIVHNRTGGRR